MFSGIPVRDDHHKTEVGGGGFEAGVTLDPFDRTSDAIDVEAMLVAGQDEVDEAKTFVEGDRYQHTDI